MLRRSIIGLLSCGLLMMPTLTRAAVDWEVIQSLNLEAEPLDAVAAPDGSYIYILTRAGDVVVFDSQGQQKEIMAVGKEIQALRLGPGNETLLLLAPGQRQVRLIELGFVQTINVAGSPFKGDPAAPVTVAVFSDFQ